MRPSPSWLANQNPCPYLLPWSLYSSPLLGSLWLVPLWLSRRPWQLSPLCLGVSCRGVWSPLSFMSFLSCHRLIDPPRPEEGVLPKLHHGFLEAHAPIDQVVDLSPCTPLRIKEHLFTGGRTSVSNVLAPEQTVPVVQVPVGDVQLGQGKERMAMRRFVLKTRCMCSSCLRVVGNFLVSSSSSFSHPSTVTFLEVLTGLSSWPGNAEMMYLLAIQPTSPCAQSLNCFFKRA